MEQGVQKKKRLTKRQKQFLEVLEVCMGVITVAVRNVENMSRTTHYRWMESNPSYREAVEDITEITVDMSESKLYSKIQEGDTTAIIFHLKTKGKKRGYIEKAEIEAKVESDVKVYTGKMSAEERDDRIKFLEGKLNEQ